MDILIVEKEKENYLGNFINNYYSVFIDIFNKSSSIDKLLLICIRMIDILLIFVLITGFILPKNLLIWHIVLCFIVLCYTVSADSYNGDYDFTFISNLTFTILKRNNVDVGYSNEQLLNASKFVPIQNKTIVIIVSILMFISILGYIYPNYSPNTLLYKLLEKLNLVSKTQEDTTSYKKNPDFSLLNKDGYNIKNEIDDVPSNDIQNNEVVQNIDVNAGDQPIAIDKIEVQTNQFQPSNTEIAVSNQYDVNLNKVDSGLSIFDKKIEPLKIKTKPNLVANEVISGQLNDVKEKIDGSNVLLQGGSIPKEINKIEIGNVVEIPLISVVKNNGNNINNKFIEKDLNLNLGKEINKEQLYNSLKKFNNMI
jgi:hypothetical protein